MKKITVTGQMLVISESNDEIKISAHSRKSLEAHHPELASLIGSYSGGDCDVAWSGDEPYGCVSYGCEGRCNLHVQNHGEHKVAWCTCD